MADQLIVSAVLIAVTTFLHGVFVASAAAICRPLSMPLNGVVRFMRDSVLLVLVGLWLIFAHFLEIALWALTYQKLAIFSAFETAFYFSSVTYTTLGLGGLDTPQEWRWLPGATAANGFLLFGMSAAFLFDMKNKLGLNRR